MKRSVAFAFVVLLLLGLSTTNAFGQASPQWTLGDWSANINGTTYNPPPLPANVNSSGFDFGTGLGTLTFTINTPGNNYVGVYLNPYYDVGFHDTSTSYGSVHGTAPSGLSYQLDWPVGTLQSGTIWTNFSGNTLDKTNTVGTYSAPGQISGPGACCSVALAEILGFNVTSGSETITFTASTTQPDGFYLQVTDQDSGLSYYLTEQASSSTRVIPEPGSMLLMASGLGVMLGRCRKFFERRNSA
jgi:hypothetical protein